MAALLNTFQKKYSHISEYISGYGILENYQNDYVIYSYNLLDNNDYHINSDTIFITKTDTLINQVPIIEQTLDFIISNTKSFFQTKFLANYGFYLTEKLNVYK